MMELNLVNALTKLLVVIAVLTGVVNILTQVIKQVTGDKIPGSLLAFIVSQVITLLMYFTYCAIEMIVVTWWMVVASIVVGFMVSYAAMFGYDKLKEIFDGWKVVTTYGEEADTTDESEKLTYKIREIQQKEAIERNINNKLK